jgi:hypothetical protein
MATPAFLRYLPSRLKPLRSPAVWAPITIFLLLSAFIWEFRDNPDWFNRNQSIGDASSSPLTPEEQAKLSEIDTIDVLLGETRTPTTPSTAANPASPTGAEGATDPNSPANAANPDSRLLSGREDPFGAYTAEYQFPGAANAANSLRPNGGISSAGGSPTVGGGGGGGLSYGGAPAGSTAPSNSSALSQALDRQQSARNAARQTTQSPAANSSGQPSFGGSSFGDSSTSQPAVSSGGSIDVPFIRTTPSMSPAVGTTGYQAPATANLPVFNIAPPQPSRNPYSPQIAPAAPVQPSAVPQPGLYTAPSSTQPAQNQQIR